MKHKSRAVKDSVLRILSQVQQDIAEQATFYKVCLLIEAMFGQRARVDNDGTENRFWRHLQATIYVFLPSDSAAVWEPVRSRNSRDVRSCVLNFSSPLFLAFTLG